MPEPRRATTPSSANWLRLRRISWMAGLLSALIPGMIFFVNSIAARPDERTCSLILLGAILAGVSLSSILSLTALILSALSARLSPQPLSNRRRLLETIILGLPLASGLIFFIVLLFRLRDSANTCF